MSSKSAPPIRSNNSPNPPPPSSRCDGASLPESSWQFLPCKKRRARAPQSAATTTLTPRCETLHPRAAHGRSVGTLCSPLRRFVANPIRPPNTPPSTPELETPPPPFGSPPPNLRSVSFVQTYPPASATHPPLRAR